MSNAATRKENIDIKTRLGDAHSCQGSYFIKKLQSGSEVCKIIDSDEQRLGSNYTFKFLQRGNQ